MVDNIERQLSDGRPYLLSNRLTETEIRTLVTLIPFDSVYHGLLKFNRNSISAMANLCAYVKRILANEGIQETVNMPHIKQGYSSIKTLNQSGIVPMRPESI
ncbi:MAG: putative glutathione S-transferase [Psychromonas sp.]|jgi:putative glutathione S-transferase